MSYSKKKHKVTRKKLAELSPKDYTVLGNQHEFMRINPSAHKSASHSMSHRVEKWVLLTLLAIAMAAFMGFKLLENSDMAFSISDSKVAPAQSHSTNSLPSEEEFRSVFKQNRLEARALIQDRKANTTKKSYATKKVTKKILIAKKTKRKKKQTRVTRVAKIKKGSVAKR
jgi:hypothetical protein